MHSSSLIATLVLLGAAAAMPAGQFTTSPANQCCCCDTTVMKRVCTAIASDATCYCIVPKCPKRGTALVDVPV